MLHDQLKYGSYSYKRLEEKMLLILNEYKINKSITLSAFSSGINPSLAIKWFIEGQKGNPNFKILYFGIKRINNRDYCEENADVIEDNDYELECVSGSWVYTTYADGKKVSIISVTFSHHFTPYFTLFLSHLFVTINTCFLTHKRSSIYYHSFMSLHLIHSIYYLLSQHFIFYIFDKLIHPLFI